MTAAQSGSSRTQFQTTPTISMERGPVFMRIEIDGIFPDRNDWSCRV